jgi:hypothetical protein
MRKATILGGIATLAILAGTATPAFAATGPTSNVTATAVLAQTLSISVSNPSIAYGTVFANTPVSVAHAEVATVSTNNPFGSEVTITGAPWVKASDGTTQTDTASVTTVHDRTANQDYPLAAGGATMVAINHAPNNSTYDEDFSVNMTSTYVGAVQSSYLYTALALSS